MTGCFRAPFRLSANLPLPDKVRFARHPAGLRIVRPSVTLPLWGVSFRVAIDEGDNQGRRLELSAGS
jgi:hypothetical protein